MDGLGVALGRHALVAPDLKAGRLVMPFDFKMSSELAYYLVYPPEAIRRRKIKAFRDWIISLAEVQQQQQQPPRAA
jgi:LysR family glycine cleavage system transcriptional activator